MNYTEQRIQALVGQAETLVPWVGAYERDTLREWLRVELGNPEALDGWVEHGGILTRAVALSPVLHVVSGNTPHAAFQSVFRGLLVGCFNRVKLPSAGLPEFERWLENLPPVLAERIEVRHDLPESWLGSQAAVIFGDETTIGTFRRKLSGGTRIIEHGPKLGIAAIFSPTGEVARRLAEDILRHDQRGCLSVQAVYVDAPEEEIPAFARDLASELQRYREENPRLEPSLSDSGAVSNLRELVRFRAANGERLQLFESVGSTDWTIILDPDPALLPGPLNGTVRLHPMPAEMSGEALGEEARHLSTVVLHPFDEETAMRLERLSPPRLCAPGMAQEPTVFWHHDGGRPLASLVRWRDLG
ncbi:MAG: acyl-CoA reductase [Luteolibacter sp.]